MNTRALEKLRTRSKHGLILQEILDTLGRWGLWLCPYVVYDESEVPGPIENQGSQTISYRQLQPNDTAIIARLEDRHIPESVFAERFESGNIGVGAFHNDRLVAYTWADLGFFPGLGDSPPIRDLEDDEAYLYGAYTSRDYRGQAIIPGLRAYLYDRLRVNGRFRFYSISVYFNRSARRFKEKLGAREIELRFSMNIFSRIHKDFLLKSRSR